MGFSPMEPSMQAWYYGFFAHGTEHASSEQGLSQHLTKAWQYV